MARLCLFQETFTKWPSRLSRTWDSVRDLTSSPSRTIGTSACEDHRSQEDERRDPGSQTQKPVRGWSREGAPRRAWSPSAVVAYVPRDFFYDKTTSLIQSRGKGLLAFR